MLHERKVAAVTAQVRAARLQGIPYRKAKKALSHFVPNSHGPEEKVPRIDLTRFNDILLVDPDSHTCIAEPGVTFSDLVRATLPHGLVPYVVPEHKGITIGGAVSGCSLESMSHKVGGFHDTCIEYELVTGEGEVVACSREHHPELFEMVHGSYGTLAVLTKLRFRLAPAKPFVRMENRLFHRFEEYWSFLEEQCGEEGEYDFVDGIVHGPDRLVACVGNMVEEAPEASCYDGEHVYYHSTLAKRVDHLATYDYFFRYDTDAHWLTRTVPIMENRLFRRYLGGPFLGSDNIIKWAGRLKPLFRLKRRPDIVVDVFIPARKFAHFFEWYAETFDFWPLWIVPYRAPHIYPWLADEHKERMRDPFLIDCAIYGKPNGRPDVDLDELLEQKVFELGGIKTLISRNFYDEETFWSIYSRPRIEAVKSRFDPDNVFGDFYGKLGRK